jgi:hypothetical protein
MNLSDIKPGDVVLVRGRLGMKEPVLCTHLFGELRMFLCVNEKGDDVLPNVPVRQEDVLCLATCNEREQLFDFLCDRCDDRIAETSEPAQSTSME